MLTCLFQTLELKWTELKDINALDLAEQAECKDFYSHTFVQRYLDEVKQHNQNETN